MALSASVVRLDQARKDIYNLGIPKFLFSEDVLVELNGSSENITLAAIAKLISDKSKIAKLIDERMQDSINSRLAELSDGSFDSHEHSRYRG